MRSRRPVLRLFADAFWRAARMGARLTIVLVPRNRAQREAIRKLKEESASIPISALQPEEGQVRPFWAVNQQKLRQHVAARDPRAFLTWDVITSNMFPEPFAPFVWRELNYLRSHAWPRWKQAIRERAAGLAFPYLFYPFSSANAIHHAYHLCRFEERMGMQIRDFHEILEIGGGYGSLCRIAKNLGFAGQYTLFDLPQLCALQRYYLTSLGIDDVRILSDIETLQTAVQCVPEGLCLFIATWSLSETPYALRKKIAEAVLEFDAFLIAYQTRFDHLDNNTFFDDWKTWFPDVNWTSSAIDHLPGNSYLFGIAAPAKRPLRRMAAAHSAH